MSFVTHLGAFFVGIGFMAFMIAARPVEGCEACDYERTLREETLDS